MPENTSQWKNLADTIAESQRIKEEYSKRLVLSDDGILIDGHYGIAKNCIDTPHKLLCRVTHLMSKTWMDKGFLKFFIFKVAGHYGINLHDKSYE